MSKKIRGKDVVKRNIKVRFDRKGRPIFEHKTMGTKYPKRKR